MAVTVIGTGSVVNVNAAQIVSANDVQNVTGTGQIAVGRIFVLGIARGSVGASTPTAPADTTYVSGWTALGSVAFGDDSDDVNLHLFAGRVILQPPAMGTTLFSIPASGNALYGQASGFVLLDGVNWEKLIATPQRANAVGINTSVPNPASITPTVAGSVIISFGAGGLNATLAAYTKPADLSAATGFWSTILQNTPTQKCQIGVGVKTDWTSGAFDGAVFGGGTATARASNAASSLVVEPYPDGPQFVRAGTSSYGTNTSGRTPTKPAVDSKNGILIAWAMTTQSNRVHATATSGWSQIGQWTNGTATLSLWAAAESAASPVFTWTLTAGGGSAGIAYFADVNASTELYAGSSAVNAATGSTTTHAGGTITTTKPTALAVVLDAALVNTAVSGWDGGYNENFDEGDATAAHQYALGSLIFASSGTVTTAQSLVGGNASWFQIQFEVRHLGVVHSLTATNLTTASPAFGAPALTQKHVLAATALTTSAPSLDAPVLTQAHMLTATALTTASPTLDAPVITQGHALTATGLVTASPVLDTPTLSSGAIELLANGITTGSPTFGAPAITQTHVLTATNLVTGSPAISQWIYAADMEAGVPAMTPYGDGGWATLTIINGSAHGGSQHLRWDPIGAHIRRLDGATFLATSSTFSFTVWLKDSGIQGTWDGGARPDAPAPFMIGARQGDPATPGPWLGDGYLIFYPAANSGWTQYNGTVTGLTPGQTYDIGIGAHGWEASRQLDIDDLNITFPAFTQKHALTAANLTTAAPVLGMPTLGQKHVIAATDLVTASPAFGTPALGVVNMLTASNLAVGSPDFGAPALTQKHVLAASNLATSAPALGSPALGQVHFLAATNLAPAAPALGTPTLTQVQMLIAAALATSAPALGTPALAQRHSLLAALLATGNPVLGTPALAQRHALTAAGLVTASPVLGTPTLTSTTSYLLTATNLVTGSPAFGSPALGQVHVLTVAGFTSAAPALGTPALAQAHMLTASSMATSAPALGAPAIAQGHALVAAGLVTASPTIDTPAIGQTHALMASALVTAGPDLGMPALGQVHFMAAASLVTAAPVLDAPTLAQAHGLVADGFVTASPAIGSPVVTQTHALAAIGITTGSPIVPDVSLVVVGERVMAAIY